MDHTVEAQTKMMGTVELCGDKDGKERMDPKGWGRR